MISAKEKLITAIDIALDPDAPMMMRAKAANARLLKAYPQGFALDATHRPHVTMVHLYVRTADLDKVYAAIGAVVANKKAPDLALKADKYVVASLNDLAIAAIVAEPTSDVLKLQQELIDAVAPFAEHTGTAAAFFTTPEAPGIDQTTIEYVAEFVSKRTGRNFHPHVTVGIAPQNYLQKMLAEPFEWFTFSSSEASVYQLGNNGTARKKLKSWGLAP